MAVVTDFHRVPPSPGLPSGGRQSKRREKRRMICVYSFVLSLYQNSARFQAEKEALRPDGRLSECQRRAVYCS